MHLKKKVNVVKNIATYQPVSQWMPVKPTVQLHSYPSIKSMQFPLLLQFCAAQLSMSREQNHFILSIC